MKDKLTAKSLRLILSAAMVVVVAAVLGGFFFAHQSLTGYAKAISQLNADAQTGDQSIATLNQIETRLNSEQATIQAARSVVGSSASFADTVFSDVNRIAASSGVTITSFEFINSSTSSTPTAATTAPAATASGATGTASTPTATSGGAPAGVTQKSISVTIDSPVRYDRLMDFIKKIETNGLKLQIANISLTKDKDGMVGTQAFSIGAYVR